MAVGRAARCGLVAGPSVALVVAVREVLAGRVAPATALLRVLRVLLVTRPKYKRWNYTLFRNRSILVWVHE